jgi:hypothetical protein
MSANRGMYKFKVTAFSILSLSCIAIPVLACVESESTKFGTTLTNRCREQVDIGWCFSADCHPKVQGLRLNPGFTYQVSPNAQQHWKYTYCRWVGASCVFDK